MPTAHPYSIRSSRSVLLSAIEFPHYSASIQESYEIENLHQSENAWLLFTRHRETNKHVVMKILRPYKDSRYTLETIKDRQQCQLKAVRWNREFTQGVHIGLAPLCNLTPDQRIINIGKTIKYPTERMLDPKADYVLLMHELRKEQRLDHLLKEGNPLSHQNTISHQYYLRILAKYMEYMYSSLARVRLPLASDDGVLWGSADQLRKKLFHNFSLVDPSVMTNEDPNYAKYYRELRNTQRLLKDDLLWVFENTGYRRFFEQRRQKRHIRRCHGDLKARNIWIDTQKGVEPWQCVSVLDAVDFNPMYSNIDILSDFAMLVADIEVRTNSSRLADRLVEDYLRFTEQQDEVSRAVLTYYLVEKAFIGAIVNIIYDNLPALGQAFLQVTRERLEDLKRG